MIHILSRREHDIEQMRLMFIVVFEDENFNSAKITLYPDEIEQLSLLELMEILKEKVIVEIERLKEKNG